MPIIEQDYLDIYITQLEKLLNWSSIENWTSHDFKKLSELIHEKTHVRLSVSTLKRLSGKIKYHSAPSATTLNTLALFLDHENWRAFMLANALPGKQSPEQAPTQNLPVKRSYRKTWLTIISLVILGAVIIFALAGKKKNIDAAKVLFESKVISTDLPNSVVFSYNIGNNQADSIMIQQSWDPEKREKVSPEGHTHTSLYYYPGYFKAKLLVNNKIIKEHDVIINTNGWQGIMQQKGSPVYLGTNEIALKQNSMEISSDVLKKKTGINNFNGLWVNFYNVGNITAARMDSFSLKTILSNTSLKEEASCRKVKVTIFSSTGFITIPLSIKGCTSDIALSLNENTINGKNADLSAFGCDFSIPQQLECIVRGKKIGIYLNQRLIFSGTLEVIPAKILGLNIAFEGAGKIIDVVLSPITI